MSDNLEGFFAGGGRAAKFPTIGTTITGTIKNVHPPEPQRDIKTGAELTGKTQVRIELVTNDRDPDIDDDDGTRTLYVRGWMKGAIGDALRKAGTRKPNIGDTLSITYTSDGTPPQPGFNGPKLFDATYTPKGAASTEQFFTNGKTDAPPPGISPEAWAAMPAATRATVAAAMSSDDPPF
jgi:hypothetical protein